LGDFLFRRVGDTVSFYSERAFQVPSGKNRQTVMATFHDAGLDESLHRNFLHAPELFKLMEVHDRIRAAVDIRESFFRNPTVHRHLTAFETRANMSTRPSELTFIPFTGGNTETGTRTTTQTLRFLGGSWMSLNRIKFQHNRTSLFHLRKPIPERLSPRPPKDSATKGL